MQPFENSCRYQKKTIMRLTILTLLLAFISIQLSVAQSPCNCCKDENRQFDFWVGKWKAVKADGSLLGTNTIDVIQDSCVLRENWRSATSGFTGTSYNYFDSNKKQWVQVWIDNQGGSLILKGGIRDGKMVLTGDRILNSRGQATVNRITWTPNDDGSVRQLWEVLIDDSDWSVAFDGVYQKTKGE